MSFISHFVFAVIFLAGVFVQSSYAQNFESDYFDLPPELLISAEVTSASRRPEKLSAIPAAVYVITSDDIRRSGVRSIPDALRMAPGVNVAQADANSWAISIRGFNSVLANKLLVMIDGRTVYNPLFAGTYWELQDMVLEDIDRIEIIRGPGGALWGANAVNGVINIITKDAARTQGGLAIASLGTSQYASAAARQGGVINEDGHYRMFAKYTHHGSFEKPDGSSANDDWQSYRGGFRTDWGNRFTLQGDFFNTDTDQLNSTPTLVSPYALVEKETMESYGGNILGRWTQTFPDTGLLTVQSYLDYFERSQILLDDSRLTLDLDTQYNFPKYGRHEVIAGSGYRLIMDKLSSPTSVTFEPDSRNDQIFSAFIQDQITLAPDTWFLTLGAKFEHNDYSGFELQPNARILWNPDAHKTIWASASRAVRTPSRLEQDLTQVIGVFAPGTLLSGLTEAVLEANPDFDSSVLAAYELGYRQQLTSQFLIDIAAFYNDYDDLATLGFLPLETGSNPARTVFPVTAINDMSAETYGLEMVADWQIRSDWKIKTGYSFIDMQVHVTDTQGFNLETEEDRSPHHQFYLQSQWDITENFSLNAAAYYYDELENYSVDDYIRLDLNLEWRAADNLRLNVVGQNLLDNAHREFSSPTSLNAAEIERSLFGKVTWTF